MEIFPRYCTGTTYLIMTLWMASHFNVPYIRIGEWNVDILSLINVTGELLQFCQSPNPGGILSSAVNKFVSLILSHSHTESHAEMQEDAFNLRFHAVGVGIAFSLAAALRGDFMFNSNPVAYFMCFLWKEDPRILSRGDVCGLLSRRSSCRPSQHK